MLDISQFAAGGRTWRRIKSKSTTTTGQEHRPELSGYCGRAKAQQFPATNIVMSHAEPFLNFQPGMFCKRADIRMV